MSNEPMSLVMSNAACVLIPVLKLNCMHSSGCRRWEKLFIHGKIILKKGDKIFLRNFRRLFSRFLSLAKTGPFFKVSQ